VQKAGRVSTHPSQHVRESGAMRFAYCAYER